jgi:PAS domain S-box-containing protein
VETNASAREEAPSTRRRAELGANAGLEAPFGFEEIFFSRTDKKGKVLFGNTVFQKVSMYSCEELQNQPHNIIRHPDMPKAIFWLLWDTITRGEPVGWYIKNRAKDGRFYWVFAIVTPIEGGYLSVRIKPSSPLLQTIEREYATLIEMEKDPNSKPAESAQFFLWRLWELGFQDHFAFLATALSQEVKSRDERIGRPSSPASLLFAGLVEAAGKLVTQAQEISSNYRSHRYVPLNLRLQAAQLGAAGSTISAISTNYGALSGSINSMIGDFVSVAGHLLGTVNNGLSLFLIAQIQREMRDNFQEERSSFLAPGTEIIMLDRQCHDYEAKAAEGLRAIAADAQRFDRVCVSLKRAATGLETTRLLGTVESARIHGATSGLDKLLVDLKRHQTGLVQNLQAMLTLNRNMERDALTLLARIGVAERG